jgi:para-aminobenzoate synthetase component 1
VELGHAIVRDDGRWIRCDDARDVVVANGEDAFTALDELARGGFWVGFCSYDLGRSVERVTANAVDDLGLPDLAFVRFERRDVVSEPPRPAAPVDLGSGTSSLTPEEHAHRVDEIRSLLLAGECYQVNLTRRITFDAQPDPLALFSQVSNAPHSMVCTFGSALPGVAIVSASPELFLRVDGSRIETRPIKGTARDRASLIASAKDHAENVMIVDLARNDLGRVCEFGTVDVPELLRVETQPGLHHLVSSVTGTLRPGIRLGDVLRATFPPASVTGAPKPRVMQAIDELEPVRRGIYCGAIGWIDGDTDRAELAVAIRTFIMANGRTTLGVGGGIVADSRADHEWAETELKPAHLLHVAGAFETEPVGSR